MVSQMQQVEVNVIEEIETVSTRLAAKCAQMYLAMQGKLENAFRRDSTELELEAKWAMTDVQVALERNIAGLNREVPQCAAVLLEKSTRKG